MLAKRAVWSFGLRGSRDRKRARRSLIGRPFCLLFCVAGPRLRLRRSVGFGWPFPVSFCWPFDLCFCYHQFFDSIISYYRRVLLLHFIVSTEFGWRVLPSFTEFFLWGGFFFFVFRTIGYWVLPDFTGFWPSFYDLQRIAIEFYRVLLTFTGFYWVFTWFYCVLLGLTRLYWVLLGYSWVLLDSIGLSMGFNGFCWFFIFFGGFYWFLPSFNGL